MSINGHLSTMPVTDLLSWAGNTKKSGTLVVERNKIRRRIHLRDGRVVGCSSDDPAGLLGQVLLSRGTITHEQLRQALERQEATGETLGSIVVSMQFCDAEELQATLKTKAEDTIYGLFEWEEAIFSFDEATEADRYVIEVDMSVDDVLLTGAQRYDEMTRFRGVFSDPGIVLARTTSEAPAEIQQTRMARSIFESINGDRTLAEILLHAHASEYLVTKFLFQLHRLGLVRIVEVRAIQAQPAEASAELVGEVRVAAVAGAGGAGVAGPPVREETGVASETRVAMGLMERGEHEAALEVLQASLRANPGETMLRELIAKAEREIEQAHLHRMEPTKVPVLTCPPEQLKTAGLSPEASFLPSLIDGSTDIKSILWLAPMRSVDVFRTLSQMIDRGLVELRDPA